ncbi:MAG: SDR family NAD(P)-dependent oxidoreductase [Burkholderiales bacterium]
MDLQLKGKTALVTGASMGIGRAIARGLAAEGAQLCVVARRRNLLEELSREVGKHGITVNCIQPGRIMSEQIRRKYPPEFRARQSAEEIPVGRYGEPEELASLAAFLASPVARYITGAVIPVDGGLRRYAF